MKLAQVQLGIAEYVQREIAEKATGIRKFAIYAVTFVLLNKSEKILKEISENKYFSKLGFIDEEGNLDIDGIEIILKQAIQKTVKFEFMGIIFNNDDVQSLFESIRKMEV